MYTISPIQTQKSEICFENGNCTSKTSQKIKITRPGNFFFSSFILNTAPQFNITDTEVQNILRKRKLYSETSQKIKIIKIEKIHFSSFYLNTVTPIHHHRS